MGFSGNGIWEMERGWDGVEEVCVGCACAGREFGGAGTSDNGEAESR